MKTFMFGGKTAILGPKWSLPSLISETFLEITLLCEARKKIFNELGPRTGIHGSPG